MSISDEFRGRRKQRGLTIIIMAGMMSVVLMVTLVLLCQREKAPIARPIAFDPHACVRVFDVTRIYRIKENPIRPRELWFCTAGGIRVLDSYTAQWTRYGLDHGLKSETIADICFAGGEPWVATWSGVARFDSSAQQFVTVEFSPGMGGTRILAVEYVAGAGIYASIDGWGLYRFANDVSPPVDIAIPGIKKSDRITCLESAGDTLFIGIEGQKLIVHVPARATFYTCVFRRGKSPKTLVWDIMRHKGRFYVATSDNGLWVTDDLSDTLVPVEPFPAKGAYCFSEEPDGFWCGTPFGLWRYYDREDTWLQYVHPDQKEATDFQVFTLANTPSTLWYGSMDMGAGYLTKDRISWQDLRAGLSNPNVAALAADDSSLWIAFGYQGGYLDRYTSANSQFERAWAYDDGIGDPHIQSFALDGGRLYWGGYRAFGYIDERRRVRRTYNPEQELPFADITAIVRRDSLSLYLAGLFGILEYFPKCDSFALLEPTSNHRVTCIYSEGDSIWYGTLAKGIHAYDKRRNRLVFSGLVDIERIEGIFPDHSLKDNRLFIVTKEQGCFILDKKSGKTENVPIPGHIMHGGPSRVGNHVMAARRIDSRIWLGTRRNGCVIYDCRLKQWGKFLYEDGLVSNNVRSFFDTMEYIWIGCYGGFNRLDKTYFNNIDFNK